MKQKRLWLVLIVPIEMVVACVVIDQLTAVRPAYPVREGDPVPARPKPDDVPFARTPIAPTFDERKAAYLQWLATQPTPRPVGLAKARRCGDPDQLAFEASLHSG